MKQPIDYGNYKLNEIFNDTFPQLSWLNKEEPDDEEDEADTTTA